MEVRWTEATGKTLAELMLSEYFIYTRHVMAAQVYM